MIRKLILGIAATGLMACGLFATTPAFAASDVGNTPSVANKAVTSITSVTSATTSAGLIGGAISSGLGGLGGGISGTPGGFRISDLTPRGGSGATSGSLMGRDSGRAAGAGDKKFGAWMQGGYASIDNSQAGLQMDGNVYNLVGGLDYKLTDRVMIGLALGYEDLDLTTTFNTGSVQSDGFSFIPYIGIQLNNTWSIDASAGYGLLSYDVTRTGGTVRGSYDAERWFASANLNASFAMGRWRLLPKVGVLYLEEKSDNYTESTGAAVTGSTTKLGRLSAGGNIGYAFDSIMPYVRITGEYDFEKDAPVLLGNGTFSHDDKLGAQLGLGFMFYGSNTFSGSVEAAYLSAGRTDLDVWSATARIRATF